MSNAKVTVNSWYLVVLSICALLTGVLYVGDVLADSGPGIQRSLHGRGRAMHDFVGAALHGLMRYEKELGLSEGQSSKVRTIATEYAKSRIRGEADLKLAELDVRTLIFNEKTELPAIKSALRKSESARTALRLEGVKALRAAAAVLTPEQREKWHQGMMRGMMHRGGAAMGERGHKK
jgi:periplasmic protein CpxP/Spy